MRQLLQLGFLIACAVLPALASDTLPDEADPEKVDLHNRVAFGLGAFNVFLGPARPSFFAEHRFEWSPAAFGDHVKLNPQIGFLVTSKAAGYFYAGGSIESRLTDRIYLDVGAGPGLYVLGADRNLGGTFEFWVEAELSHQFHTGQRLGVTLIHLSNAYIHEDNPSSDSLFLFWEIPY